MTDDVQPGPALANDGSVSRDDRTMAMLCHLLSFAGLIAPLGNIIGPLVLWLVKRESSAFIDDQGREVINFQISITIYAVISAVLVIVFIGILLLLAVAIFSLVVTIIGAIKANDGIRYRYPLCIRFIR